MVDKKPYSNSVPFFVGPNVVYICPSSKKVLTKLGNVANITLQSSMRVPTIKFVCDLLFEDLLMKPINILGKESYNRIRV